MEKYPICGIIHIGIYNYFASSLDLITSLVMKKILSERNIVVILFVMVLVTFSLSQEDSKKMEKKSSTAITNTNSPLITEKQEAPVTPGATFFSAK